MDYTARATTAYLYSNVACTPCIMSSRCSSKYLRKFKGLEALSSRVWRSAPCRRSCCTTFNANKSNKNRRETPVCRHHGWFAGYVCTNFNKTNCCSTEENPRLCSTINGLRAMRVPCMCQVQESRRVIAKLYITQNTATAVEYFLSINKPRISRTHVQLQISQERFDCNFNVRQLPREWKQELRSTFNSFYHIRLTMWYNQVCSQRRLPHR